MAVLVTGGAGYIGSVNVEALLEQGEQVVVLDNLSRGYRDAVPSEAVFVEGNIGDAAVLNRILSEHEIEACLHFAAYAYVGESVTDPAIYFENNVQQGITLLNRLVEAGVKRFIFSSTCATYGEPERVPIDETHPQHPANPYGWSKFFMERILVSYDTAYGLKFVALRYFNAAGATRRRGERHDPETHILPIVLEVAQGKRPHVPVLGGDYPTPDGTAIRDYIHVSDLASAHLLGLKHLREGKGSEFINLGNGHGYTVLEIIRTAEAVTGKPVPYEILPRRAGDPTRLVADASKAHGLLGWTPEYPQLETILRTAWEWMESNSSQDRVTG